MRPRPINLRPSLSMQTARAMTIPATGGTWYRIENAASGAEIYIYDSIGWWGVTASDFVAAFKGLGSVPIGLHINSGGGDVWDGAAIYEALRTHEMAVTAYVDGIAASAASLIAMAADRVVMGKAATMMIHDAACDTFGNARVHRADADLLEKLSGTIAAIYADRTGGEPDEWRAAMQAGVDGTWYTAAEAVAAGLADEIAEPPAKAVPTNRAPGVAVPPSTPEPTPPAPLWDVAAIRNSLKEAVS